MSMLNIMDYESFLNESKIFEGSYAGTTTKPVEIAPTKTNISVVRYPANNGSSGWYHDDDLGLDIQIPPIKDSAIRFSSPSKSSMDYKIEIDSSDYKGKIIPADFYKNSKSDSYVILHTGGEGQEISGEDVKKIVDGYNQGQTSMSIPMEIKERNSGKKIKVTLRLEKTPVFASVK